MLSPENLLLYIPMSLLLVILPGPDFVLIARVSLSQGKVAGQAAACGIALGICLHTTAAILGISALIAHSVFLFSALKYMGALWLLWLGIQSLRAGHSRAALVRLVPDAAEGAASLPEKAMTASRWRHFFAQGFVTNALNPKAILLFLTFLPQFMDLQAPLTPQFLTLGGIMAVLCLLWYVPLAHMLGRVRRIFENSRFQLWLQRCTGIVFIAFGLRVATAQSR
jgi:RhtB (resistance to homoserine/threonine) family protein